MATRFRNDAVELVVVLMLIVVAGVGLTAWALLDGRAPTWALIGLLSLPLAVVAVGVARSVSERVPSAPPAREQAPQVETRPVRYLPMATRDEDGGASAWTMMAMAFAGMTLPLWFLPAVLGFAFLALVRAMVGHVARGQERRALATQPV